ncbi:MAG TPA: LuxR C-terminal-related transcriptional regulator [Thermoanaerobaculia bacterium]|nr:LuxR C-terminal-related transcriptional regulator [Thermoanaerobaculia bacterium]
MAKERGDAGETAALLELVADLASAERNLTSRETRLLTLLAQGFTHREIGDRLGVGWKSVGVRVRDLRRKLRSFLAPDPGP